MILRQTLVEQKKIAKFVLCKNSRCLPDLLMLIAMLLHCDEFCLKFGHPKFNNVGASPKSTII